MSRLAIVAIGGNSLIIDSNHKTISDQFAAAVLTMRSIADMIEMGWDVVITHGNGPQIGYILRRSELALHELHPVPMDYAGADTQGAIGYMIQKALRNELSRRSIKRDVVTLVTQVRVSSDDPALSNPVKPIGSFMQKPQAQQLATELGWVVQEDAGRGWRRLVPSPVPVEIVEMDAIRTLSQAGYIVVTCGGGGIPVIERSNGDLRGVEAVIDKDFASSMLACNLATDLFVISTGVEKVAINYQGPDECFLDTLKVSEARKYHYRGHFAPGSMGPKISAMIQFVETTGKPGLITDPPNLGRGLRGQSGTHFSPD